VGLARLAPVMISTLGPGFSEGATAEPCQPGLHWKNSAAFGQSGGTSAMARPGGPGANPFCLAARTFR
jgi:hypothetical protein